MHGQGFAGGRKAQRAELGGSCKGSWAGQGGNTQIEAQCIPTSHGRSIADANALPGVLHAIAQRRPRAHFRAGDDTAELAILPPPRDRDRSRVGALYVGKLSLLGGLSHIYIFYRVTEVSRAVLWRAGGCRRACKRSGMTASTTERRCYRYQTPYMYAQPALSVFLFVIGKVAKLCLNLFY